MRRLPFDLTAGEVVVGNDRRRLPPQEQSALDCLLRRPVATPDQILTALYGVWAEPPESASSVVRVVISNLRRKLEPVAVIYTITGRGYRLDVPANDNQPASKGAA